jgi:regulator of protease activity HflC (stomatin/prohibitin superfamily)
MITFLVGSGVVITWLASILVTIYLLAKVDVFFTFVNEGEILFIDKGETLHRTLVNVRGIKLEGAELMFGDTPQSWNPLTRWFGIYGPFLWPIFKVHEYPSKPLCFQFVYLITAKSVEMKDQLKINVRGTVTAQVVIPYTPVYKLKGNWFPPFNAAIEGAIADYVRTYDYGEFIAVQKEGNDAPISQAVRSIGIVESLRNSVGIIPVAYHFNNFEIADDPNSKIKDATEARKLAEEQGKALIARIEKEAAARLIEAQSKRQARELEGAGEAGYIAQTEGAQAEAWKKQAEATGGTGVLKARELRRAAEGLGDFKGNTLVVGQGATPLLNTATDKEPEKPKTGEPA